MIPSCSPLAAPASAFRVLAALLFSSVTALAADLYVATNGVNDAATGRGQSLGNPYRTIDYAADRAAPGDTIYIRAGSYRETVTPGVSGTVNAPITFKPYNNESVILTGLDAVVPNTNGAGAWTVDSGDIYRIQLTSSYGTTTQAGQQVFVNGQLMVQARWPNSPTNNPVDFDR
ncbi:MAG: hypothetical protein H7067_16995, partial [Burkholderiales bacterium]|nr:hypothetical protein [Opitutaceae bacterium]